MHFWWQLSNLEMIPVTGSMSISQRIHYSTWFWKLWITWKSECGTRLHCIILLYVEDSEIRCKNQFFGMLKSSGFFSWYNISSESLYYIYFVFGYWFHYFVKTICWFRSLSLMHHFLVQRANLCRTHWSFPIEIFTESFTAVITISSENLAVLR